MCYLLWSICFINKLTNWTFNLIVVLRQFPNLMDEPDLMYFRLYMSEQYQVGV